MNDHARNGKIARLPQALREEINLRLAEGATARGLVAWLNGLPGVQALMEEQFGGHPIREQNISQWRNRGYEEWLRQQEAVALAKHLYEQAEEIENGARVQKRPPMSEVLKVWLTARYAVAARDVDRATGAEKWRKLRQMCTDVAKLRRMDQDVERLAIRREGNAIRREQLRLQQEKLRLQEERQRPKRKAAPAPEAEPSSPQRKESGQGKITAIPTAPNVESIEPPASEEPSPDHWKEKLSAAA